MQTSTRQDRPQWNHLMGTIDKTTQEAFSWLQYVLNPDKGNIPYIQDWQAIYDFVVKQQIIGVCSPTPYSIRVDQDVLFQWIGDEQQIRNQNKNLNKRIEELSQILDEAGFRSCILKGQGNAVMYPDPGLRSAGDIDVWIDADEKSVIGFVMNRYPNSERSFKHIKFPIFDDVDVDVHTTPLRLYHPCHKIELKKWILEHKNEQFDNHITLSSNGVKVSVPTARFNVVYQMGHILIHLLDEGIGLRHIVDYYYVLQTLGEMSDAEKHEIAMEWRKFGMLRLASGVMWVEKEILGLPEKFLIVEPNAKIGNIVLSEMLEGGNFGHHSNVQRLRNTYFSFRFAKAMHLMKIASLFPGEAIFRMIHKFKMFIVHIMGR